VATSAGITDFPDRFAYDEMACEVLFVADKLKALADNDVIEMQTYLQTMGLQRIGKDAVHDAIGMHARRSSFHPIRDYLNGLEWDRVPRLDTWLAVYLGATQNEYTVKVGTMFMISAVARIMRPGCQVDYTLIIEGSQGELKSSVCRILAGEAFFSDNLPPLSNKDSSQHLRGKWIIEIAEMHTFKEAKINQLKAFITRREEKYFARYGRTESKEPRQCVFVGTTNQTVYLYDETGNRRSWPVTANKVSLEALKRDRDQLWAEAKARFDAGENWWPSREFERQYIMPEQQARYQEDAWTEKIIDYLNKPFLAAQPPEKVTIGMVAQGALHIEPKEMGRGESDRIAKILTGLKWSRSTKIKGQQTWLRPPPPG
jgi:predicted P-loop ATPase